MYKICVDMLILAKFAGLCSKLEVLGSNPGVTSISWLDTRLITYLSVEKVISETDARVCFISHCMLIFLPFLTDCGEYWYWYNYVKIIAL